MKELNFNMPETMLSYNISGHWDKEMVLCTKCLKPSIKHKTRRGWSPALDQEKPKTVKCPYCSTEYQADDIVQEKYISLTSYAEWTIGYVETVKYDNESFYLEYKKNFISIANTEEGEDCDLLNLKVNLDIREENIVVDFHKEKYKTKNEYKFVNSMYCKETGEKYRFNKGILSSLFDTCLNTKEIAKLSLAPYSSYFHELIYEIRETYKKHLDLLELGLASIADKDNKTSIMSKIKESDEYYNLVKNHIDQQYDKNFTSRNRPYFDNVYISAITSHFPTTDSRYYKLLEQYTQNAPYYVMNAPGHYLQEILLYCLNYDYSEEEIDLFLQMMYKQAFSFHDINKVKKIQNIYTTIGVPIQKLPKELYIYTARGEAIEKLIQNYWYGSTVLKFKDYACDITTREDNIDLVKKAISYNQNYNFLNKLLHDNNEHKLCLVTNTDYYLVSEYRNNEIVKIYNKDKEVTNEQEKEKIFLEIITMQKSTKGRKK